MWAVTLVLVLAGARIASGTRQKPFGHGDYSHDAGLLSAQQAVGIWAQAQDEYAQARILANTAPFSNDITAMAGAMCASPSRAHPDYYYAWTRDAGLVMSEVLEWLGSAQNNTRKQLLLKTLDDYVGFSKHLQGLTGLTYGLGEAKFHMDGSPFRGSWCNPQTDGPAIRARTLIKYARYLAKHGRDVDTPYKVAIRDLDYVVDMWRTSVGCDIWEESRGRHYYTLTAQCQALQEGAQMAVAMGDAERAQRYTESARAIQVELLPRFWDSRRGYIVATLDHAGGIGSKRTNLDAQVLLAALHHGGVDRVGSPHMADTVLALLRTFEPLYAVNQVIRTVVSGQNVPIGVAVGRYPEDVYNGDGVSVGNPWSLITSAIAEYHYILALQFAAAGQARIDPGLARLVAWTRAFHGPEVSGFADALADVHTGSLLHSGRDEFRGLLHYLLASGDLYMARVCRHTADDHTMYEQWSRYTGYGRGAIHLTWSYAAHSSAQRQRTKLVEVLGLNA